METMLIRAMKHLKAGFFGQSVTDTVFFYAIGTSVVLGCRALLSPIVGYAQGILWIVSGVLAILLGMILCRLLGVSFSRESFADTERTICGDVRATAKNLLFLFAIVVCFWGLAFVMKDGIGLLMPLERWTLIACTSMTLGVVLVRTVKRLIGPLQEDLDFETLNRFLERVWPSLIVGCCITTVALATLLFKPAAMVDSYVAGMLLSVLTAAALVVLVTSSMLSGILLGFLTALLAWQIVAKSSIAIGAGAAWIVSLGWLARSVWIMDVGAVAILIATLGALATIYAIRKPHGSEYLYGEDEQDCEPKSVDGNSQAFKADNNPSLAVPNIASNVLIGYGNTGTVLPRYMPRIGWDTFVIVYEVLGLGAILIATFGTSTTLHALIHRSHWSTFVVGGILAVIIAAMSALFTIHRIRKPYRSADLYGEAETDYVLKSDDSTSQMSTAGSSSSPTAPSTPIDVRINYGDIGKVLLKSTPRFIWGTFVIAYQRAERDAGGSLTMSRSDVFAKMKSLSFIRFDDVDHTMVITERGFDAQLAAYYERPKQEKPPSLDNRPTP